MNLVGDHSLGFTLRLRYQAERALSYVAFRLMTMAHEYRENARAEKHLRIDRNSGALHRTGLADHYAGDNERAVWHKYRMEFFNKDIHSSEVVFRAFVMRDRLIQLINEHDIRNVVNFGCSYGWLENEIAVRFPDVMVWGVDRNAECMALNAERFWRPNCRFAASDIFKFLKESRLDDTVLCHVNVGVYFLPTFLRKLYMESMARFIVCCEPSGISRQTHRYYSYGLEPRPSQVFRGPMLLNNYPGIMTMCGYDVIHSQSFRPPHPHKDFRSVVFVGRKRK